MAHKEEQISKLKAGKWMIKQFPKWGDLVERALSRNQIELATKKNEAHSTYHEAHAFVDKW